VIKISPKNDNDDDLPRLHHHDSISRSQKNQFQQQQQQQQQPAPRQKKPALIFHSFSHFFFILFPDRSASFSARPRGDTQFQRLNQQTSNSTSQLQSQDLSQPDFAHGSSSTITSSAGGSSGGIAVAGSPQTHTSLDGIGEHTSTPVEGKQRGKQKSSQPNARSESYKECSPKRSRTNRPKSDPSLYE
jgi:hypothetical protein